jgi:pimeloyl-ACP methyl ester carboxylesterase
VGDLLERELAVRGITKVAVVGHSAGAYRAFALALSGRITVTRVVSLGGMAGYDAPVRAAFRKFAGMVREGHDLRPMWLARMASPGFGENEPAGAAEVMSWILAAPPAVLADELDAFGEAEDLRPRLRDLAIPILARVGARDEAVPIAFSQDIVKNARRARLQIVAGCGHALFHEDRRATVEAVATWLEE